jgi:hypothetical protein
MGTSQAFLESCPGNGSITSITSGVPKKSRHCGNAAGILGRYLGGRGETGRLSPV